MRILQAERVKSPRTKSRTVPKSDFYEVITGKIMIELNDYFDEMTDKEWDTITSSIVYVLKKTRARGGSVITTEQKVNEIVELLTETVYTSEKNIRKCVENALNSTNMAL